MDGVKRRRNQPTNDHQRCACCECIAGDNLPPEYQGWPGAYQLILFPPSKDERTEIMSAQNDRLVEALAADLCNDADARIIAGTTLEPQYSDSAPHVQDYWQTIARHALAWRPDAVEAAIRMIRDENGKIVEIVSSGWLTNEDESARGSTETAAYADTSAAVASERWRSRNHARQLAAERLHMVVDAALSDSDHSSATKFALDKDSAPGALRERIDAILKAGTDKALAAPDGLRAATLTQAIVEAREALQQSRER